MEKDVRLFVSVASARDWKVGFGSSIVAFIWNMGLNKLGGRLDAFEFQCAGQALLIQWRQDTMTDAIKRGFTHYLSLDDDMKFPPELVERMLAHNKPVVCANYPKKDPKRRLAVVMGLDDQMIDSAGKTGLQEVGWMGMGVTLVDLRAIKEMPQPYFEMMWSEERQQLWGEDYVFSFNLRQHGVPIFCDHDLSQEIGHIGDIEYRFPKVASQEKAA